MKVFQTIIAVLAISSAAAETRTIKERLAELRGEHHTTYNQEDALEALQQNHEKRKAALGNLIANREKQVHEHFNGRKLLGDDELEVVNRQLTAYNRMLGHLNRHSEEVSDRFCCCWARLW
eukprot:CAMPEP_0118690076 /NCGR_PEP_ID=MMETSP0800-20121206/9873_1 /TAXON_ID=210618 ORGANISM="Striatella unipunctata, Strain CCMP2910" /NCGR_SAMPLE_ID=MMETSP0800 /ASSEMBLY_ACC=CAM_ASM_000638 /LENGTH=120 /DNA_ID=CAMNT_0006587603 /DNA_START=269 /DNA_END=628 /DNA_ORIENTATION=+